MDRSEGTVHSSFCYWLSRLSLELQDQFNREFKDRDITWPQWLVLSVLYADQASTPAALADYIGVDRSAVTRLLDRLEKKQLVIREHDKLDRRSVNVSLTPAAKKLMPELVAKMKEFEDRLMAGVISSERNFLQKNLQKMLRAFGVDSVWR